MRQIRRFWKTLVAAPLLLVIIAAAVIFWPVNEDLSSLADAGQGYDVEILRDVWGVPHIFGATDAAVAYGLAYAHAEDDFLTIQQTLLAARGRLATVYGADAAPNDYMVQLLRIPEVVAAGYTTDLSAETRALVEAYAAGLNRYAALHSAEALPGLFPVTGEDIVAGSVHKSPLFFGLDKTLGALFADERQTPDGSPTPPSNSNAFAVGPGRSANGETFLAVNSHQPWSGPVAWYEAHLHSAEGWDAVGALFPGVPTIVHGHNRDLGWAFTVNHPDLIDVYVLEINPANPNQYRFDGAWRDLEVRPAPITVRLLGRLNWTVQEEALWSVYGPVVRRPHGVYAIRYAGMGRAGIFEQLYRMNRARNLSEWQAAMELGQLPLFNTVYADRAGNIAYLYNALLPVRAEGYDWQGYLPGDTSATLWRDYLPIAELPQVLNPPAGFVQNANNTPFQTTQGPGNPDPADFAPTFGIETRMTNRALRLRELFDADEAISAEEFVAYKYDVAYSARSDVARYVQMLAAAPPPADADMRAGIAALRDWDLRATEESTGTALLVLTLYYLDHAGAINPSALAGDPVEAPLLTESFSQAVQTLKRHFGRVAVPWAEVNRLRRGDLDLGLAGAPDVLHAVYGALDPDGRFRGIAGDAYVLLVTWDADGALRSQSIHQFGSATLDERSPHYADQAPLFARRELKPVWFDEAAIRANLSRAYRP